MKTLLVTNRNIANSGAKDHSVFGEKENVKGASELRFAWVEKRAGNKWRVELVEEPTNLTEDNLPSAEIMNNFWRILLKEKKNCLFYIHGFNSDFRESLDEAEEISEQYDIRVVLFSWPSNPGGFITNEYKRARTTAMHSIVALDRAFSKLHNFQCQQASEDCDISINLLTHSLGSFIFERFARDPIFSGETRIFDNIILNAADVDIRDHRKWANKLKYARRIYATINESDKILGLSDIVNPDRLGNTSKPLDSDRITYFDLSDGKGIGSKHRHFKSSAAKNTAVKSFFKQVLKGEAGFPLKDVVFDSRANAYKLDL